VITSARSDQESVVLVGLEEFLGSVEQEPERKENFDIGPLLEDSFIDGKSVLELVNADSVVPWLVANGVQGVEHDSLGKTDVIGGSSSCWLVWSSCVSKDSELLDSLASALTQTSSLDPVSTNGLVGCDDEIVSFSRK
jgi:hypothetical protein